MVDGVDEIGTSAGSNVFFSPEACKGSKYSGKLNDIWATGVTLFYMVTKQYPFMGTNFPQLYYKIQNEEPVYPETLDPQLVDLLKNILNKNVD